MAVNLHTKVFNLAGITSTQTSQDFTNEWGCGAEIYVNMTAVGTGSVTLTIQGKDETSGTYYTVLQGAPITTNGFTRYQIFPGSAITANSSANDLFPFKWRIIMTANNANPTTYSVGVTIFG